MLRPYKEKSATPRHDDDGGAADCCVSRFRFSLLPNFFHCLADLGGLLVGSIADGDEGYGFEAFGHGYDVVELVDVEVAHPACGKPLLGGCQAIIIITLMTDLG